MDKITIIEKFHREVSRDKESGSYLFYGDERVDLLEYALEFAKMLISKDVSDEEIKRKIENQIDNFQYPDLEVLNKNGENIKIDEVRKIIMDSAESGYSGSRKVYVLAGVEQLRKEASNSLLKVIEEPPKNVFFILLSRSLDIIPTIKSRVIKYHLRARKYDELGVSKKEYYFFDGQEKNIAEWKNRGYSLEQFENMIRNLDDVEKYILDEKSDFDGIIGYNKSVEYICENIYYFSRIELFRLINIVDEGYKQNRDGLLQLLNSIVLKSKKGLNEHKLKTLINIKNSVRNNVNIRSIVFNFFECLYA